MAHSVY